MPATTEVKTEDKQEEEPKKKEKVYKYHGLEYPMSATAMAATVKTSLRTTMTFLKLKAMGYESHMMAGWTATQCFAHAGLPKRKPAPTRAEVDDFKTVIIYLRGEVNDAVAEIKRLRELLQDLGVDPDG